MEKKLPGPPQEGGEDLDSQGPSASSVGIENRLKRPPGRGEHAAKACSIEEHWLGLAGGRMRYLKAGSGPPLILVHGLLGYSFSWRFAMPALAPFATVYAIDNLGAGFSVAPPGMDCRLRATAERVLQFADATGIGDFDLLGTSHGGGVAIIAAAICAERRDPRLRRLILVAPINPWSSHGKRLAPLAGSVFGKAVVRATVGKWRQLDAFWLGRMFGDKAKVPPDSLDGYRRPVFENRAYEHGLRIVGGWTGDLRLLEKTLPKIVDYPSLLMWGTRDRIVDYSSAESLRQNFRHARLVAIQGAGHLPYEEAPEEFNHALIGFLTA